mmetsp:Transcript_9060/g.13531  ORF Transcript_9060/g.13531 Transcript_9060/m.13531 type:complete len:337 (-) Transcript_9060:288-1298(-)|eukprot:CAMPEP_0171461050 /NCGR_PEP_ID=MMETSP0945-20130129/5661_1 /TAXON_ID=109269 /ORGANISM="Vaucheria litorea, Strain CCMP2940" /LENGTH=336 /DNA_ID=CAMNT_0011987335 /DNA_START=116 /DNA_END=1126 /DNA_ORIENTATION=+
MGNSCSCFKPTIVAREVEDFEAKGFEKSYKLGKTLGKGAYSVVKEGTHIATGKVYAIKCVQKFNLAPDDEADLMEEIKLLHRVKHPNIIDIFQVYKEEKDCYYVVIEYMRGGELFDRIVRKQYYNEKEARDLVRILLSAVSYLHEMDIVHRDLKPENLLLTTSSDDANIKIADFGFAKSLDGGYVNTQCGTPAYVAPEILRNKPYGTSVDMWSIGVIIYILLGGYPPFHGSDQARLFRRIRSGSYKFHPEYWSGVSNEACDLIRKLLTVDVSKRITAAEALNHPWLIKKDNDLASRSLENNLDNLRLFNARRKLRAAIKSTIATAKFAKIMEITPM